MFVRRVCLILPDIDTNGAVVVKYKYDAWGNHEAEVADETFVALAEINPFRYRGYYYDEETDLYFLQTRYYDPEVGRFISRDSIEYASPETICGLNLYAYCGNNPVMNVDPSGNDFFSSLFKIIVGVLVVGATVAVALLTAGTAIAVVTAGAAIGSALGVAAGGISGAISAAQNGTSIFDGFANGALSGSITGAISGGIAGSGIAIGGQILLNASLGAGEYLITTLINGNEFDFTELISSIGAAHYQGL